VYLGGLSLARSVDGNTRAPVPENKSPRVVLAGIPSGDAGAIATLKIMRQYVRAAVRNPAQIVRAKALELVRPYAARRSLAEIRVCYEYVRDAVRYVRDPVDVELVQTPEATLEIMQGDCDDKSTLLAALLTTIGHPCRFVALGFNGNGFSHVLVETRSGAGWLPLETILPVTMGWYPEGVTKRYVLSV
jgi:transglutaminase-like putative cysteine protease